MNKETDFKKGDFVCFQSHPEGLKEYGVVTSTNKTYVHVLFDGRSNSQGCYRRHLRKINTKPIQGR